MKKVLFFSIIAIFLSNYAFAVTKLNPTPGVADATFDNYYGTLKIGEQYKTGSLYFEEGLEFDHTYRFTLPDSGVNVNTDFFNVDFGFFSFGTDKYSTTLYKSTSGIDTFVATGEELKVLSLYAGDYFLNIIGTITGDSGGYNLDFSVAQPVPVPAAALLLCAGLLGIVGIRRRQTV